MARPSYTLDYSSTISRGRGLFIRIAEAAEDSLRSGVSFMKFFLTIAVIAVVAGSLYADYKWRQWVAARKRERDHPDSSVRP